MAFSTVVCVGAMSGGNNTANKEFDDLLAEATQGNAAAQYNLGWCYQYGIGVGKDYEKAVSWYTKAAKQGDVDAQDGLKSLKPTISVQ